MRTAKNILMHEFIGLPCKVMKSRNRYDVGLKGKIIDEGMKTITLKVNDAKKLIMKKDSVFRMDLDKTKVDIDGNFIIARPEDRIKKKFKKW